MENAAKALLIAGGVLISNITSRQEQITKENQLNAFNAEYEAFNKPLMYGVDVITLANKVNQNNTDKNSNVEKKITFYFTDSKHSINNAQVSNMKLIKKTIDGKKETFTLITYSNETTQEIANIEKNAYKCINFKYNTSGRVSSISIEDY